MARAGCLAVLLLGAVAAAAPPTDLGDGSELRGESIRIALVGGTRGPELPWRAGPLLEDIAAADPDLVLATGDAVGRSTRREWQAVAEHWQALGPKTVFVAGAGERRGDGRLSRYARRFPSYGIEALSMPSWWHLDAVSGGVRWRFVLLDADREALGRHWDDQLFWVPKVVGDAHVDHVMIVLNRPIVSLAVGARNDPASGAIELLEVIQDHIDPRKLMFIVSGGTGTNELFLQAGPWGEVLVVAGNGGLGGRALRRRGSSTIEGYSDLSLVVAFDRALAREAARGDGPPVDDSDRFPAAFPVEGWWQVDLAGREPTLRFRMRGPGDDVSEVFAMRYTRAHGWIAARSG